MWLEDFIVWLFQIALWLKLLVVALSFVALYSLPDPLFRSLNYIHKIYEPAVGILTLFIGFMMILAGIDVAILLKPVIYSQLMK